MFSEVIEHWPTEIGRADGGTPPLDAEGHSFPAIVAAIWERSVSPIEYRISEWPPR